MTCYLKSLANGSQKYELFIHDRLKLYHSDLIQDWTPSVRKSLLLEDTRTLINKTDVSQQTDNINQNHNSSETEHISEGSDEPPSGEKRKLTRSKRPRRAARRYGYD